MYAKLVNGVLYYAPKNYITSEENLILNFNKNEELMKQYGFKELIDIRPSCNPETQYLSIDQYQENNDTLEVKYMINDIEVTEHTPSLEERIIALEKQNINIIATNFDIDYRLLEFGWMLEESKITDVDLLSTFNSIEIKNKILSRYKQAKAIITGKVYDQETLTKQLTKYLEKEIITQIEYDELIALMEING